MTRSPNTYRHIPEVFEFLFISGKLLLLEIINLICLRMFRCFDEYTSGHFLPAAFLTSVSACLGEHVEVNQPQLHSKINKL